MNDLQTERLVKAAGRIAAALERIADRVTEFVSACNRAEADAQAQYDNTLEGQEDESNR